MSIDKKESFSHHEIFGDLREIQFSLAEAAEYLELSIAELEVFLASGSVAAIPGTSNEPKFATDALRALKKTL
jgi:hypothetical protein